MPRPSGSPEGSLDCKIEACGAFPGHPPMHDHTLIVFLNPESWRLSPRLLRGTTIIPAGLHEDIFASALGRPAINMYFD
jgi:hypothetical protein